MPFFSIITPTLQRESLSAACVSVEAQGDVEWEHIIMVDQDELNFALLDRIRRPQRIIVKCQSPHRNGGNTCRRNAWSLTTGQWVYYLDDDNLLVSGALEEMEKVLTPLPGTVKWALFPIVRMGGVFYSDPPRSCHVDTLNFVLRREIAQWPDTDAYGSDGVLIDRLMEERVPYAAFPAFPPIAILPKISFGKP